MQIAPFLKATAGLEELITIYLPIFAEIIVLIKMLFKPTLIKVAKRDADERSVATMILKDSNAGFIIIQQ